MTEKQMGVVLEVVQDDGSTWRDAVYLPRSEAVALTDADIERLTAERYEAHKAQLAAVQEQQAEPVTPEQEGETLDTLRTQLVESLARVDELLAAREPSASEA